MKKLPPSITIAAGAHLLVWASDKDRTDPAFPLHTSFRLSGGGELGRLVFRAEEVLEPASCDPGGVGDGEHDVERQGVVVPLVDGGVDRARLEVEVAEVVGHRVGCDLGAEPVAMTMRSAETICLSPTRRR